MKPSHIEHLGIAVKSLDTAIPFWEKLLGTKCYNIEEVPAQKVRTAFLKIGQTKIELLDRPPKTARSQNSSKRRAKGSSMWRLPSKGLKTHWPNAKPKASS